MASETRKDKLTKTAKKISQDSTMTPTTKRGAQNFWTYPYNFNFRRRKRLPRELAKLSLEEEIVCIKKNLFDRLQVKMSTRFSQLKDSTTKHRLFALC